MASPAPTRQYRTKIGTPASIPRIFSPAVNQDADAWKFQLRLYHDMFVLKNKTKGIYVHKKSTANS